MSTKTSAPAAQTITTEQPLLEQVLDETRRSGSWVYDRMREDPMEAAWRMGKALAGSGLFGAKTPEQGTVLAMEAMFQGRSIMDIARRYHVIEGRLSKRADAIQAEFQAAGGRIQVLETTAKVAKLRISHPVHHPEPLEMTITREELDKAGVTKGKNGVKDNYEKFGPDMLWARLVSRSVRRVMPGIVVGIYTPEEVSDFEDEPPRATTPPPARRPAAPRVTVQAPAAEPEPSPAEPEPPAEPAAAEPEAPGPAAPERVKACLADLIKCGCSEGGAGRLLAGEGEPPLPPAEWTEDNLAWLWAACARWTKEPSATRRDYWKRVSTGEVEVGHV